MVVQAYAPLLIGLGLKRGAGLCGSDSATLTFWTEIDADARRAVLFAQSPPRYSPLVAAPPLHPKRWRSTGTTSRRIARPL